MSVMFDSDSDTSVDINAMAMKYLSDEQLTHMTKLQRKANIPKKSGLLRHVLRAENMSNVSQDVSRFGMSPSDITLNTQKYLEKYGLLNSNETLIGENTNLVDQTLQLRLNYSILTMDTASPAQTAPDDQLSKPCIKNERDNCVVTPPARKDHVPQMHNVAPNHSPPIQNLSSPQQVDNGLGSVSF